MASALPRKGRTVERQIENFEHIATQYTPMINSIIRSLHIYTNKEEFYQIGLIALWEAARGFDPEKGKFETYAYRFIKGRMMIELTRCHNQLERNIHLKPEHWELLEDQSVGENEISELIEACGNSLTKNQLKWLKYACQDQLTIQEIAVLENVSVSTVKSWRDRARKNIKTIMEENGF